jgi:hypothetical protein
LFRNRIRERSSQRPEYWSQLIKKIKKIYSGNYAANWDDFDKVPFWNELDYIGIDAYFPLSDATTPSVLELNDSSSTLKNRKTSNEDEQKNTLYRVWLP